MNIARAIFAAALMGATSAHAACVIPEAQYPAESRKFGAEGTALVKLQVAADGKVVASLKQSAGDRRLDAAALEAAGQAKCDAGTYTQEFKFVNNVYYSR